MDQGFIANTQVSEPNTSGEHNLDYNMNGFGWDVNKGMFIPVEEGVSYFQDPFPYSRVIEI